MFSKTQTVCRQRGRSLTGLRPIFVPCCLSVGRERDDEGLQDWEKVRQDEQDEREEVRREEREERKQGREDERETRRRSP
jgi:hypothetical protein